MKESVKKVELSIAPDIEKIVIKRDYYFANAYIIDLPLDSTPDHVWQDIFEKEWKSSRHLWDRKLFVLGSKLRLVTSLYEVKEKLDWVKEVVERTNKGVDEYNREAEARAAKIEEEARRTLEEEKANVEMIRDILRKKFVAF